MITNCFLAQVPMLAMFALFVLLFFLGRKDDACTAAMIGFASGAWTHLGIGIAYSSDHIIFWWMFIVFIGCILVILLLRKAGNCFEGGGNDRCS